MTAPPSSASPLTVDGAPVAGFILSGGAARRAGGRNKSFLQVEGRPILSRQIELLGGLLAGPLTVVTDRPRDYEGCGVATIGDPEDLGPERCGLRGLAAALGAPGPPWRFVLASDMPWPDPGVIRAQLERVARDGPHGVCLNGPKGAEPFHAIYHASLAESARVALDRGDRSMRAWIAGAAGRIDVVGAADLNMAEDRLARCLANFNRPPGADERP